MITFKNFLTILLAVLFGSVAAFGQLTDRNDRQNSSSSQQQSQNIMSQLPAGRIIQDGPVDPAEYVVGPGDIFTVSIWAAQPLMFQVPVTPEGSVVIPTVAEVHIAGETLENAKKMVLAEIRKKYVTGSASFTLLTPRSFTVTVIGTVLNEGTVVVQSTQRVDAALRLANDVEKHSALNWVDVTDKKQVMSIQKKLSNGSRRNIIIQRRNGDRITADIHKYIATSDARYNPLLLDGDVIIVPPKSVGKNEVGIYGAVRKEGNYEFVSGDSVALLLRMGGGLTSLSDGGKATLHRISENGNPITIDIDVSSILEGRSPDVSLHSGDRLIVKSLIQRETGGIVTIEGEVARSGSYPIIHDSTTLSQVISMAGGFTKFAGLNGARIINESARNEFTDIEFREYMRGRTTAEDTAFIRNELTIKSLASTTPADFVALFEKHDLSKDVKLADGDKIIIPRKSNSVYVFGEVRQPGSVSYQPGMDVEYYLTRAGGTTEHAETGDMRVIKAGSRQWLTPSETVVGEGDYIFVPKEPFRPFTYYLTVYSQVFGIVGTIATLFLLISQ